jgi:hypothetical protein
MSGRATTSEQLAPIIVGGRRFRLPAFTDPEHARYTQTLVLRLVAEAASLAPPEAFDARVHGMAIVSQRYWLAALGSADGPCPLLAGLLVDERVPWSTEWAIEASEIFGTIAGDEKQVLVDALLPALGNVFSQERAIAALVAQADPRRRYQFRQENPS